MFRSYRISIVQNEKKQLTGMNWLVSIWVENFSEISQTQHANYISN